MSEGEKGEGGKEGSSTECRRYVTGIAGLAVPSTVVRRIIQVAAAGRTLRNPGCCRLRLVLRHWHRRRRYRGRHHGATNRNRAGHRYADYGLRRWGRGCDSYARHCFTKYGYGTVFCYNLAKTSVGHQEEERWKEQEYRGIEDCWAH